MSDALEALRARNRFEEELPSGLKVTIRLPRLRDCILAGDVPLPVLDHLVKAAAAQNGDAPTVSNEDAAHMARFQDQIVRRAVVAIEGQAVALTTDDVAEFKQDDYDRIVQLATRSVPTNAVSPA